MKPTREDQSKSQFVDTDLPLIPARGKFAASIERLLDDLVRYAEDHPEFQGSVFRDTVDAPIFALRYLSQEEIDSEIIECSPKDPVAWQEYHDNQNNGVRALDSIAGRIMRLLSPFGVVFPEGTSKGASVMAWALSDSFYSPCGKYARGKVQSGYRPFESVREKLLETLESIDYGSITTIPNPDSISLASEGHDSDSILIQGPSTSEASGIPVHTIRPEDCDDDLWSQLNNFIESVDKTGGAYRTIECYQVGRGTGKLYLQSINQLASEAGWKPFIFDYTDRLEVLRTNGKVAVCHRRPTSHLKDEQGAESVMSALKSWRAKRALELSNQANCAPCSPQFSTTESAALNIANETSPDKRTQTKKRQLNVNRKDEIKKVIDIDSLDLPSYITDARRYLRWENNVKGRRDDQLRFFLDDIGLYGQEGERAWTRLRQTQRRRYLDMGYTAKTLKQWVAELENEAKKRGISIPDPDDCE